MDLRFASWIMCVKNFQHPYQLLHSWGGQKPQSRARLLGLRYFNPS